MACTSNVKGTIYFSEPQNRDDVISIQFDLDVKFLVQRHGRCLVLWVPRGGTLTHLHRLYLLRHDQLLGIRTLDLPGFRLDRRAGRCCL